MSTEFDPYYTWLGIPPQEQPPHCYRLLGVTLFEPDCDVISAAADRLIAQLRMQLNSPLAAVAQRLLQEIAWARQVLLTPASRMEYDSRLRAALHIATDFTNDAFLARLMALDATAPILSLPQQPAAKAKQRRAVSHTGPPPVERHSELGPLVDRPTWLAPMGILIAVLLTIGVVGGIMVKNRSDGPRAPRDAPLANTQVPPPTTSTTSGVLPPSSSPLPDGRSDDMPHLVSVRNFTGQRGATEAIAFFPDGQTAISAGGDHLVHRWEIATGTEIGIFRGHEGRVNALAVSPLGDRIASGGGRGGGDEGGDVRIWDVSRRAEVGRVASERREACFCVKFSPDGSALLSAHTGTKVYLSNAANGSLLRTYVGHTGDVMCVAFAPDGLRFVSGSSDHTMRFWEVGNLRSLRSFGSPETISMWLAILDEGRQVLSAENDGVVRLWDSNDGRLIRTFGTRSQMEVSLAVTPDQKIAISMNADGNLRVWDIATGEKYQQIKAHEGRGLCVALSPDGRHVLSGGADEQVRLWRLERMDAALLP